MRFADPEGEEFHGNGVGGEWDDKSTVKEESGKQEGVKKEGQTETGNRNDEGKEEGKPEGKPGETGGASGEDPGALGCATM